MNKKFSHLISGVILTTAIIISVVLAVMWCTSCTTNDAQAIHTLDVNGFSNITINDRGVGFVAYHGCGEGDGAWYEATANNPAGRTVNVTVCCGVGFKGCTIRTAK